VTTRWANAVAVRAYSAGGAAPAKTADWDSVEVDGLPEAAQRELMGLQKAVADMRDAVARSAYKGPEPDFAGMRKGTTMPEIVDEFEKAYKGVTKPDAKSPEIEALRSSFVEIEAEAKAHAEHATKRIAELDLELKAIEEQRSKLGSITMDEYFQTNPELKKKIDDRIKNDQWFEV
jgi:F-type H+-transporting ATPase subunit d